MPTRGAGPPTVGQVRFCPWCGAPAGDALSCPSCDRELDDTRIGGVLGGKYRIDSLLGQGGFGRVYKATHLSLDGPVAIKFLLAEWASRPDLRTRFKREAAALVKLHHPGIVAAYDFGEDEGSLYLVMEYVQGESLASHLVVDGKTMPTARAIGIIDQLLQVLEGAHLAGIVHRDLKPENVMLLDAGDRVDRIKVLDFGLALMATAEGDVRLTPVHAVHGTPLYMSPEQCLGGDVGPATDVYAAGVMLYEMLAGDTPFRAESMPQVMAQHMYVTPPPMAQRGLKQAVSPSLERIVSRTLAKKPEDRPSAAELRDELRSVMAGTDRVTQQAHAADGRVAGQGQSRDERGLPRFADTHQAMVTQQMGRRAGAVGVAPRPLVLLWVRDERRGELLRDLLAVGGMEATAWVGDAAPPAIVEQQPVQALVIAGDQSIERLQAVRAHAETKTLPVMVVDVTRGEDVPLLIRAGASDATMRSVADDQIAKKVSRMIQRKR